MARAFADITFTPSVKAAQTLYHSREHNRGFELAEDPRSLLTEVAKEFIAKRDSFIRRPLPRMVGLICNIAAAQKDF